MMALKTLWYNVDMKYPNPKYTKQAKLWVKMYSDGLSHKKISAITGYPKSTVYAYLKHFGVIKTSNMSLLKMGDKNPMWKGDGVQVNALHAWVRRNMPMPTVCDNCHSRKPLDCANINDKYNVDTYTRDLANWRWLCRRCHMIIDGRYSSLRQNNGDTPL